MKIKHKDLANAVRFLSLDTVEAANSGHPGMPMGMADVATVLFKNFLRFNPKDPSWFKDAPVHENVKKAIVNASELDTRLIMRSLTNTERVLTNPAVDRLMEKEKALGEKLTFSDIVDEVAGVYPTIMMDGDMDAGAWSCGMVAGLVYDIPSVKELIDRIMSEAEEIIQSKLKKAV